MSARPPTGQPIDFPSELDATGYQCPMPVIRMEAALRRLTVGAVLIVRADDPLAAVDIPHFCREAGHAIVRQPDEGGADRPIVVFAVTKAA